MEAEVQITKQLGVPNMAVGVQVDMEPLLQTPRTTDSGQEDTETLHHLLQPTNMVVTLLLEGNTERLRQQEVNTELRPRVEASTEELRPSLRSREALQDLQASQADMGLPLPATAQERTGTALLLQT